MGFERATPIQARAIPVALGGRDLVGQAQTGSGKTAAFGLPILERIELPGPPTQALVLCPTRELTVQVSEEIGRLASHRRVGWLSIFGGDSMRRQLTGLRQSPQIIVATPGRLLDHLQRGSLSLAQVRFAVLDEADRMLDMGFAPDVERILRQTPPARQTMLFSATMPEWVRRLASRYMRDPETVSVTGHTELVPTVRQWYIECSWADKVEALTRLLDSPIVKVGLIFTETKRNADLLHSVLLTRGYDVTVLHGDLSQHDRDESLERFRHSRVRFLIATNVAARGLDIEDISHVINYDVPATPEEYVHRVGRTARAGRDGVALTLITPIEILKLRDIERHTNTRIERHTAKELEELVGEGVGAA
ncbi:MAG TPA: DEAD/DEAH box helicase [Candidatus Micrarchaeia archaeon]|nr:DEAD/DEAH box helicase [Candidatus Micrarchaeia archaeon]